jgi:hypothetical protein
MSILRGGSGIIIIVNYLKKAGLCPQLIQKNMEHQIRDVIQRERP